MSTPLYKEAILCLMFAMAEADTQITNDELIEFVGMKDIFTGYSEQDIITLYNEYKKRFADKGFSETTQIFVKQIPAELHMATLSIIADVAVTNFDMDIKEGSFISIVANAMNITDVAVKTLLLASLSKKLLMNMNTGHTAGNN